MVPWRLASVRPSGLFLCSSHHHCVPPFSTDHPPIPYPGILPYSPWPHVLMCYSKYQRSSVEVYECKLFQILGNFLIKSYFHTLVEYEINFIIVYSKIYAYKWIGIWWVDNCYSGTFIHNLFGTKYSILAKCHSDFVIFVSFPLEVACNY